MRDFFIPTSQIKIGSSSLPILIRMGQYDKNIGTSGDLTDKQNAFLNEVAKGNLGCMGNNSFDFGIDCRHYPLVCSGTAGGAHEETAAFQKINHTLQTTIFPSFKRKDLENDFIILEIPDYGNQSMSPFYRDFTPHVYYKNAKIWQKYVGVIKHYSKKTAYILIDKTSNNLKGNITTDIRKEDFAIRICFKNNIEISSSEQTNLILTISDDADNNIDLHFKATNVSNIFSNGSFNSLINNLNDYIFKGIDKSGNYSAIINPIFIQEIKFSKNTDVKTKDIGKQGSSNNDYFAQAYQRDYLPERTNITDYIRPQSKVDIELVLKQKIAVKDGGNIEKIEISSKQNYYNAIYPVFSGDYKYVGEKDNKKYYSLKLEDNTQIGAINSDSLINVFNLQGKKISITSTQNISESAFENNELRFEIIPEYTCTRRIRFAGVYDEKDESKTEYISKEKIKEKFPYLSRWYLDNAFCIAYSKGYLVKDKTSFNDIKDTNEITEFIIYDNGEDELSKDNFSTATKNADAINISMSVSTNKDIISNIVLKSDWGNNPDQYQYVYTKSKQYFKFKQTPLSFYIYMPNGSISNARMIAHNFIIPLELSQLDNNTWFVKLPDYFVKDNLMNKDDINNKLNTSFLNSIEPIVYINMDKGSSSLAPIIYNLNHLNEKLTNINTKYKTLHPLNIVNFSTRNEE